MSNPRRFRLPTGNRRAFLGSAAAGGLLPSGLVDRALGQERLTLNQAAATVHPLATQSAMRMLRSVQPWFLGLSMAITPALGVDAWS
jgi:hypothetical protein